MFHRRLVLLCGAISCGIVAVALGMTGALDENVALRSSKAQDIGIPAPLGDDGMISVRLNLPRGTVIRDDHVLGMAGQIRVAVERSDEGLDQANLRTLGRSVVNGVQRSPDIVLSWGDHIDIGAFYNAGDHPATILFDSHLIVELEPGEVILASAVLSYDELVEVLQMGDLRCKCECDCATCEDAGKQSVPCDELTYVGCDAGDCDCFNDKEETCVVEVGDPPFNCTGTLTNCKRIWTL